MLPRLEVLTVPPRPMALLSEEYWLAPKDWALAVGIRVSFIIALLKAWQHDDITGDKSEQSNGEDDKEKSHDGAG